MELLEPNCCRLNYSKSTLWLWHILIICSPPQPSSPPPLVWEMFRKHGALAGAPLLISIPFLCLCARVGLWGGSVMRTNKKKKKKRQPSLPLLPQMHTWGQKSLRAAILKEKKSTSHFRNIKLTQSNPAPFRRTPWCTFLRLTSCSISSEIKSYDEQTVELAAAHRPPPFYT